LLLELVATGSSVAAKPSAAVASTVARAGGLRHTRATSTKNIAELIANTIQSTRRSSAQGGNLAGLVLAAIVHERFKVFSECKNHSTSDT